MLSPVEKLNAALRDNRPEDYITQAQREIGLRPVRFRSWHLRMGVGRQPSPRVESVRLCGRRLSERFC